jgi:hypothetical protein
VLDDSLALVGEDGWVAFQPFPEALRAEVALRQGDPDRAVALLDHAFALGCRIGDPCWEAVAARARGLVYEAAGERPAALAWLRDAAVRVRGTDRVLPLSELAFTLHYKQHVLPPEVAAEPVATRHLPEAPSGPHTPYRSRWRCGS